VAPPDHTVLVRITKKNGEYVADPDPARVPQWKHANIVFVLENAPMTAELLDEIEFWENGTKPPPNSPFSKPSVRRALIVNDDNTDAKFQKRKFIYKLKVQDGNMRFPVLVGGTVDPVGPGIDVDPGIDNDPP
jgi:hypothetical protein